METLFDFESELKKLPKSPGVYLMHGEQDEILYVGKAINLYNRVHQYFRDRDGRAKIRRMMPHVTRFEYIVTDSEVEALILECNLIKEHHPKYNTMLMDDKAYPYIKVTVQEEFPRLVLARKRGRDKARYFGPYTSVGAVREIMELLRRLYFIRSCNRSLPRDIGKERPCLNYHIERCKAPCQGYISKEEYGRYVEQVIDFLNGNTKTILRQLQENMEQAARDMEYERAGEYKKLMEDVRAVSQKQKMTQNDQEDRDIVAVALEDGEAVAQVFFVRDGRLIGREHFYLRLAEGDGKEALLQMFLAQFYAGTPYVPREIIIPWETGEEELLNRWLTGRRGSRVTLRVPKAGKKEKLMELAAENAALILKQDRERLKREKERTEGAVAQLGRLLGLPGISRMEAYDISNISGVQSVFACVGSMVVYEQGRPRRNDYRKFRLRTLEGPDDYGAMEEVLTRRFEHGERERRQLDGTSRDRTYGESGGLSGQDTASLVAESSGLQYSSFVRYPDLILMDGGKGQVNVAEEVLRQLGLSIPVAGMVKDDHHRTRGLYYHGKEYDLAGMDYCFQLLTRIQDEAHRFAITYHRSLRSREQVHSVLDDIPGVGPARRKALMMAYGSLEDIRNASEEELASLSGMNRRSARQVYEFFHDSRNKEQGEKTH